MYSNKVMLAAGLTNDTHNQPTLPHPIPYYRINELTINEVHFSNLIFIYPISISMVYFYLSSVHRLRCKNIRIVNYTKLC